ncbi:MAG: ATP-binding cassette domain-containing protein, partial [Gammaproteobacteria bacterium]|nr:ATP-binding cassette domain-containing protein [Gammaproteobacteria bacterium]
MLNLVELDGIGDVMPADLSGGMRKRVALARAIALAPRALLYDEPTTGLDPITANTINQLIRSLQKRLGVTSIVVTHDIHSA